MAFRRAFAAARLEGEALTSAMVSIGMAFAGVGAKDSNIEDTLLSAAEEAMDREDLRVLAVLTTWFGIHAPWVNADRLVGLVEAHGSRRVRALFSALASWKQGDRRFARLVKVHEGPPVDLLGAGGAFHLRRHGEDPRFSGSALRVPGHVLRDRPADVLGPAELARRHRPYRLRVAMGPSYRADMWAAIEVDPALSAAELARRAHGSFATAWHVRRDFLLVGTALASAAVGGARTSPRSSNGRTG